MAADWHDRGIPNPGSAEAVERGCLCAVEDNHFGAGITIGSDGPLFWITVGCPLHGWKDPEGDDADS